MSPATLLVSALVALLVSLGYAYVGHRLWHRPVGRDGRSAVRSFAVWAYAIAFTMGTEAVLTGVAALGLVNLAFHVAATLMNLLAVAVGLTGLLYYVAYLFTGRRGTVIPVALFYASFYAFFVFHVHSRVPVDVAVGTWRTALVFTGDPNPLMLLVILGTLVVPQTIAAFALFTLPRRVSSRAQKYRILLVAPAILLWTASMLLAAFAGLSANPVLEFGNRFLGLSAAFLVIAAYFPPRWAMERWGLTRLAPQARPER